jgi:hypothetical protein
VNRELNFKLDTNAIYTIIGTVLALARVVYLPPQMLKTIEKAEKTYFMGAVSGYLQRAEPALQSLIHPFKVIFAPG